MRKTTLVLCGMLGVAACAPYETDLDKTQITRDYNRAIERQENGCQLTDDHLAYRDCLVNTYKNKQAQRYKTTVDEKGKSVAIVKNESKQSYDEKTGTYKTERVIVIETEEKLVPVPVATEEVVTEIPEQTIKTDVVTETKTVEEVAPVVAPAVVPVAEAVTEPVEEPKRETWWDDYQKNKQKVAEPQCPCPDPNEPCPQCVEK